MQDGKKVSITENKRGIIVSVGGKRVRAKNPAELKKKYPDAYRLYNQHLGNDSVRAGSDSATLLKEQLRRMRDNADNPQMRNVIEQMLQLLIPPPRTVLASHLRLG